MIYQLCTDTEERFYNFHDGICLIFYLYFFELIISMFFQNCPIRQPWPEHQLGLPAPAMKALEEAAAEEPGGHEETLQPGLQRSGWQKPLEHIG